MSDEQPDTRPLKDRVLSYILATDYVSFAELSNRFGDAFHTGDYTIGFRENLYFWAGMTQEACDAVRSLLDTRLIHPHPSTMLIYLIDGRSLSWPIAKRVRDYTKPHWLPVTLRPGPPPKPKKPRARAA